MSDLLDPERLHTRLLGGQAPYGSLSKAYKPHRQLTYVIKVITAIQKEHERITWTETL